MRVITLLMAVMLVSCASNKQVTQPLAYSFLPKYVDLDTVGGYKPKESFLKDSTLKDFKSIPLDSGKLITPYDTLEIPSGILISDRKAANLIIDKADYKSTLVQLKGSEDLRKAYYVGSLEAESLYQKQIIDLRKEAKRTWFETNGFYIGFTTGIVTTIASGIILSKTQK